MDVPVLIGSLVGTAVFVCCIIVVSCLCFRHHIKKAETRFIRKAHQNHTKHAVPPPRKLGDMIRDYFREQENKESNVFRIKPINAEDDKISELDSEIGRETKLSTVGESEFIYCSEECAGVRKTDAARELIGRAFKCSSARSLYTSSDLAIDDLTDDPLYDIDKELRDFDDTVTDGNEDTNDILGSTNTIYTGHQSEESDTDMYPPVEERAKTPFGEVDTLLYNPKQMYPPVKKMSESQFEAIDISDNTWQMDDFSIILYSKVISDSAVDTSEFSSVRLQTSTHTAPLSIEVDNEINDTSQMELKQNESQRCISQSVSSDAYLTDLTIIDGTGCDAEKITKENSINAKIDKAEILNDQTSMSTTSGNALILSDKEQLIKQDNKSPISVAADELPKQTNINRSSAKTIIASENTVCNYTNLCSDLNNRTLITDNIKQCADQKKSSTVADDDEQTENTILTNGTLKISTKQDKNYETSDKKEIKKKGVKRRKSKRPQASKNLIISNNARPPIPISFPRHAKVQRGHAFLERLYLEEQFLQRQEALQNNIDLARKRKREERDVKRSKSLSQPAVVMNATSPSTQPEDVQLKSSLSSANKVYKKRSISFKSPEPTPDSWMRTLIDTSGEHKKTCVLNTPSTAFNNGEPVSLSHIMFDAEVI